MLQTGTPQHIAGESGIAETEIAQLEEIYDQPSIPEPGPGDILITQAGKFGHLTLRRANITRLN